MVWSVEPAASGAGDADAAMPSTVSSSDGGVLSTMLVPRLARAIVAIVFVGFCSVGIIRLSYSRPEPLELVLAVTSMVALLVMQLFYFARPVPQLRAPTVFLALLVQASLVYLPLLVFEEAWIGMPGFLAGSALLVLPTVLAWGAYGLVVASMVFIETFYSSNPVDIIYTGVSTGMTGLVVYGLTRLANLLTELHAARIELARMAVAQERLRFARDLHDLLGYSLSAITLKSELTHRLVAKNPEKAQNELAEILDISRRALSDVRSVASGYRELSLDQESESARSVLVAADVQVGMDLDYGDLPTPLRTMLATVLREGVTNVLRHSKAERCEISVRQSNGRVLLEIINDGVQHDNNHSLSGGGSGIRNLSGRLAAMDGELTAGLQPDGRYRLHAWAPVRERAGR